jgi:hypothetical protein
LDVLPVKIVSPIRACGAALVSNTPMFAALFRRREISARIFAASAWRSLNRDHPLVLRPSLPEKESNKDHFRMKSHRDQAGAQSTSAAPVASQKLVSQKILNRALGDSA